MKRLSNICHKPTKEYKFAARDQDSNKGSRRKRAAPEPARFPLRCTTLRLFEFVFFQFSRHSTLCMLENSLSAFQKEAFIRQFYLIVARAKRVVVTLEFLFSHTPYPAFEMCPDSASFRIRCCCPRSDRRHFS